MTRYQLSNKRSRKTVKKNQSQESTGGDGIAISRNAGRRIKEWEERWCKERETEERWMREDKEHEQVQGT